MFHEEVADRWNNFTIFEQMANIGAEVGRTISWKEKGNEKMWKNALYRTIELIDLTVADPKNLTSIKEILRIKEVLGDKILGENIYKSTKEDWDNYFLPFNFVARNVLQ